MYFLQPWKVEVQDQGIGGQVSGESSHSVFPTATSLWPAIGYLLLFLQRHWSHPQDLYPHDLSKSTTLRDRDPTQGLPGQDIIQCTKPGWAADIQMTETPASGKWREQTLTLPVKPHLLPPPPGNTKLLSPLPGHPETSQDQGRHSSCILYNLSSDFPGFSSSGHDSLSMDVQLDPTSAWDTKVFTLVMLNSAPCREHERGGRKTKCALRNSWLLSFRPRPSWRWEQLDTFAHTTPEKALWNLAYHGLGGEGFEVETKWIKASFKSRNNWCLGPNLKGYCSNGT